MYYIGLDRTTNSRIVVKLYYTTFVYSRGLRKGLNTSNIYKVTIRALLDFLID